MSTILHLVELEQLIKLETELERGEFEDRRIYALPAVIEWLHEELPNAVSDRFNQEAPLEQFDTLLWEYCSGQQIVFNRQIKPIKHIVDGIWELKTADLRLFGWFPSKDCFVCAAIDTKFNIMEGRLYPFYRDQAVRMREALDLDEPKFIVGDDPNAVISCVDFSA